MKPASCQLMPIPYAINYAKLAVFTSTSRYRIFFWRKLLCEQAAFPVKFFQKFKNAHLTITRRLGRQLFVLVVIVAYCVLGWLVIVLRDLSRTVSPKLLDCESSVNLYRRSTLFFISCKAKLGNYRSFPSFRQIQRNVSTAFSMIYSSSPYIALQPVSPRLFSAFVW